jgi:hypothetical protein
MTHEKKNKKHNTLKKNKKNTTHEKNITDKK